MVDFKRLLSPEALSRLTAFERQKAEFAALTDEELAVRAQHYLENMGRSPYAPGDPVYDGVVVHVVLPELIKRLGGVRLNQPSETLTATVELLLKP